jgi:hypothetical protein
MKTKMFITIEECVASNPDKETVTRVLNTVNRGVVSQMRRELNQKNSGLKKIERTIETMKKLDLPITMEVQDRIKSLKSEITDLKNEIPEPVKREPVKKD